MATALHSRYLQTADLDDQYDSAGKQLEASRTAASFGLREDRELCGDCLDLTFHGEAGPIANLVEHLDQREIYISRATADDEVELETLKKRVGELTYVSEE